MKVPVPREIAKEISADATRISREYAQRRGWSDNSINSLMPVFDEGLIGIRTTRKHLHYQNAGTKPFVMWWAEGKVIPLPSGPIVATRVGKPGWGYQDRYNKKRHPHTGRIWREQRWRHPGIDKTHFMQRSLYRAIKNARPTLQQRTLEVLAGRAREEDLQ